jgi:putative transposase
MPRIQRALQDDGFFHVLNRGNAKKIVFHNTLDYSRFLDNMKTSRENYPIDLFAYCLMPNHFHFIVRPNVAQYLSKWMHLLLTKYVRYYHKKHNSSGHIWQGRFKSFLIQDDDHLVTVLRYVEGNPVRAGLVNSSVEWKWVSLNERWNRNTDILSDIDLIGPPKEWTDYVDTPLTEAELEKARTSVNRQTPFGDDEWTRRVCKDYGLNHTVRRGRPRVWRIEKLGTGYFFGKK